MTPSRYPHLHVAPPRHWEQQLSREFALEPGQRPRLSRYDLNQLRAVSGLKRRHKVVAWWVARRQMAARNGGVFTNLLSGKAVGHPVRKKMADSFAGRTQKLAQR